MGTPAAAQTRYYHFGSSSLGPLPYVIVSTEVPSGTPMESLPRVEDYAVSRIEAIKKVKRLNREARDAA